MIGPDGLPLRPVPFAGSYAATDPYYAPAPQSSNPYRIRKPAQRSGSIVDSQAIARALEAEQRHPGLVPVRVRPLSAGYFVPITTENKAPVDGQNPTSLQPTEMYRSHSQGYSESLSGERASNMSSKIEVQQKYESPTLGSAAKSQFLYQTATHKAGCHGNPHTQTIAPFDDTSADRSLLGSGNAPEHTPKQSGHIPGESGDQVPYENTVDTEKAVNGFPYPNFPSLFSDQLTIYTMPSTYATASHPLNPTQLDQLHQNPYAFSQTIPEYASYGLLGLAAPSAEGNIAFNPAHNCNCGDTCNCLGCAAHPYNTTTRNHVQNLGQILVSGANDTQVKSRPQSLYDDPFSPTIDIHNMISGIAPAPIGNIPSPPTSAQHEPYGTPNSSTDTYHITSNNSGDQSGQSIYSSTAYYTMEFPMDQGELFLGCNDISGTCQCDSNCTCVGCLTHNGHTGDPLSFDTSPTKELLDGPS